MQAHLNSREDCLAAERQDALGAYKARFALPPGVLYMDGNSLGPLPHAAKERARQVIEEEWGQGLIRSWNQAGWFELPVRLGDKLARLLGAGPGELAVTDTTSINLFKALAAALDISTQQHPGRKVILSEKDNFPTDLYMAQGLAQLLQQGHELRLVDETLSLEQALDETVAVLLLSHVNYRSGAMHDMRAITQKAHDCGALVIWDLAHSAGAVPVDLHAAEADFAVGCTYKYLNAGPGAPAFIWAAARHAGRFHQPLSGWWSHEAPFAMRPGYAPATGAKHLLCGTQPMISLALVECGLDIALEAGMGAVRRKSLELGDLFIRLVQTRCAGHDLELVTPLEHARRGSHVSFAHPQGHAIMQALIARGVIGDYREPHILRFGLTPLYFGYSDVWDAVEILRDILQTRAWDAPQFHQRQAVT